MKKSLIYILFLLIVFACSLEKKLKKGNFEIIITKLGSSVNTNTANENIWVAEAFRRSNRLEQAVPFYQKALAQGISDETVHLYLAQGLKVLKDYDQAKEMLKKYLEKANNEKIKNMAEIELSNLKIITTLAENTYYKVKNLTEINTEFAEYSPVYNHNQGSLYFTSNREGGKIYNTTGTPYTDIYKVKTKGAYVDIETLISLDPIINHNNKNEGSIAMPANSSFYIFARGNDGKAKGFNEVNLFYTRLRNQAWITPRPLSLNRANAWDSSPTITSDGNTMYFSSNREGGYGGTDLYVTKRNRRGEWVDIRNLGPEINTPGNEFFPFSSRDGSLYFSSTGHPGFGKLDIFRALRDSGKVTIKNLGKPMNSSEDDFGFYEYNLTRGFFTSNRRGGKGDDDIYTYINHDPNLKIVNYFLTGTTITLDDGDKEIILPNTKVIIKSENDDILDESFTNADGEFTFRVYPEEDYVLLSEKIDYFTVRKKFSTIGKTVDKSTLTDFETNINFNITILMERIVIEKPIVINNIYYDLDKANIRPDAAVALDSLVQVMNDNPDIYIELGSHTDDRNTDQYNLDLSRRRAQSAVQYIIKSGIPSKRIVAKGYGESQLIILNALTEEEHQKNRRTEFKILKYNPKNTNNIETEKDEYDRFFIDIDNEDNQ